MKKLTGRFLPQRKSPVTIMIVVTIAVSIANRLAQIPSQLSQGPSPILRQGGQVSIIDRE